MKRAVKSFIQVDWGKVHMYIVHVYSTCTMFDDFGGHIGAISTYESYDEFA